MQIRSYDEVDAHQVRDLWADAFGSAPSSERLAAARLMDVRVLEPFGLFAVEGGSVLGSVLPLRLELQLPAGVTMVGGIQGVATAPHVARRGVASALLEAAHERLRQDGLSLALLLTRRSWVAHGFYQRRGYHDVDELQVGTRSVAAASTERPAGAHLQQVGLEAQPTFFWLFRQQVAGGRGFVHRHKDHLSVLEQSGDLSPTELWLCTDAPDGSPIGYAIARRAPFGAMVRDVCALPGRLPLVLGAIESTFGGEALHVAPVCGPQLAPLQAVGFTLSSRSWSVLMACDLRTATTSAAALQAELGTDSGAFWLCSLDRF